MRENDKPMDFTPDVIKALLSGLMNEEMLTIEMTSPESARKARAREDINDGEQ